MGGVSLGGEHPTMFAPGCYLCLTHQASHSFAGEASALIAQFPVDARTPISALVLFKHLPNLLSEESIFSFALTGRALAPSIQATFRDSENLAHDHDRNFLLVLFDKLLFHLDSREKMLRTFLGKSPRHTAKWEKCCPCYALWAGESSTAYPSCSRRWT